MARDCGVVLVCVARTRATANRERKKGSAGWVYKNGQTDDDKDEVPILWFTTRSPMLVQARLLVLPYDSSLRNLADEGAVAGWFGYAPLHPLARPLSKHL